MKIMMYINSLEHGGAERVLSNLANQFTEEGNEVFMVTTFFSSKEYDLNCQVKRVDMGLSEKKWGIIKKNIVAVFKLRRYIKEFRPDIMVSFLPEPNFRAILASLGNGVPVVISVRNDPNREYAYRIYYYLQKLLYPLARGIVFQTEDAKKWFPHYIQKKSEIILNQVDERFFNIERSSPQYYCAIGRLTKQKNYSLMLQGFLELVKKYPEEKLFIYGVGEELSELRVWIKENRLEDNMVLKGNTDHVPEVLSKAKALLMTSDFEGMPNVLLEAMAVGVPIIATDCPCGGPRTVIKRDESGILIPVRDKDEFIKALFKVQEDEKFRESLGKMAKKDSKQFSSKTVFNAWKGYLIKCLGNRA